MMQIYPSLSLKGSSFCYKLVHPMNFPSKQLKQNISNKRPSRLVLAHGTQSSSGTGERELRNLKRMMRLHSALKNKNIPELCRIFRDECLHCCTSQLHPLSISKNVLQMLMSFMARNNTMFVVKPTKDDGVDVGFRWLFVWDNLQFPVGFGCSIYTAHVYEGSVYLRNPENIIKCWIHLETFPQKLEEVLSAVIDKLIPIGALEGKKKVALMYCLMSLVFTLIFLTLLKGTLV